MAAMDLAPLITPLRHTHVTLVATSVGLFALRWLASLVGARWPQRAGLRRFSMALDMLLLASGLGLWWSLGLNPVRQTWLGAKLLLLLLYIALGIVALRGAGRRGQRLFAGLAALAVVGWMAGIALHHDPRGVWLDL